jgi:hypothetical protein
MAKHPSRRRAALLIGVALAATIAVAKVAWGAACHDEADRLADRHRLAAREPAPAPEQRAQARDLLDAARKADDDGIVEACLRQLAEARALLEGARADAPRPSPQR